MTELTDLPAPCALTFGPSLARGSGLFSAEGAGACAGPQRAATDPAQVLPTRPISRHRIRAYYLPRRESPPSPEAEMSAVLFGCKNDCKDEPTPDSSWVHR